jgi:uncharacterized membrane protein
VLSIQLGFSGVLLWDSIGLSILPTRATVVVLYVSFALGIVTLRTLRLHYLGGARTLYCSVGLSLALHMLIGFLLNLLLPLFGVSRPIRMMFIAPATRATVLLLLLGSYLRDALVETLEKRHPGKVETSARHGPNPETSQLRKELSWLQGMRWPRAVGWEESEPA